MKCSQIIVISHRSHENPGERRACFFVTSLSVVQRLRYMKNVWVFFIASWPFYEYFQNWKIWVGITRHSNTYNWISILLLFLCHFFYLWWYKLITQVVSYSCASLVGSVGRASDLPFIRRVAGQGRIFFKKKNKNFVPRTCFTFPVFLLNLN